MESLELKVFSIKNDRKRKGKLKTAFNNVNEILDLSNSCLTTISLPSIFSEHPMLKTLLLSNNSLSQAMIIPKHDLVEVISLARNNIRSINIEKPLSCLKELNLSYNKLTDFELLHGVLPSLEILDISHNRIEK